MSEFDFLRKWGWVGTLLMLGLFILGLYLGKRNPKIVEVEKPYPVTVEKPVPVHDTVYSTKTVYLPKVKTVHDTVTNTITETVYITDSVQVQVPITLKDYDETVNDANVKIQISGFEPNLEKLTVTNLREKSSYTHSEAPLSRFSIGIDIGYGFTMKTSPEPVFEARPYLGVGLHYSLIQF